MQLLILFIQHIQPGFDVRIQNYTTPPKQNAPQTLGTWS